MNWLLKMDFPAVEVDSKWLAARDIVEINTERGGGGDREGVVRNDFSSVSGGGFVWRTFGCNTINHKIKARELRRTSAKQGELYCF